MTTETIPPLPSLAEPVSEEEYRQAIELAQTVVRWAEQMIERGQA